MLRSDGSAARLRAEGAEVVDDPDARERFLVREALVHHPFDDALGDADAGAAGADHDDALVGELGIDALGANGAEEAGERDGAGALDVVVEAEEAVAVRVEDVVGVLRFKVLELHEGVRPAEGDGLEQLVHERVVIVAVKARVLHPEVVRVGEEGLVVRAAVEHDREHLARVDAAGRDVERELADGDAHSVRAEVAQTQDAGAVGDDNDLHVVVRPVVHHRGHLATVLAREVHAARAAEVGAELLADDADRRRVHDGRHLLNVSDEAAEEERLVAILQRGEELVLLDVRLPGAEGHEHLLLLRLNRQLPGRHQPADPQPVPLRHREARPLVRERAVHDPQASPPRDLRLLEPHPVHVHLRRQVQPRRRVGLARVRRVQRLHHRAQGRGGGR